MMRSRIGLATVFVTVAVLGTAPSLGASNTHAPTRPPRGYHTVMVTKAGFTIAVPDAWKVATNDPEFRSTNDIQVAFADRPASAILLVLLIPGASLPTTGALRSELVARGAQHVHISRTKVAGLSAIEAVGSIQKAAAGGKRHTVFNTIYLLRTPNGLLDFDFGGRSDGRRAKTVQAMIHSVVLVG